jgi:hypothetical protein
MGIIFDDLEDHEGYAARRLRDRTLTSTWTRDTDAFGAFVAACSCGWTGRHDHPPTGHGRTTAEDECELHHAQPVLAAGMPTRVRELTDNLREEVAELADHRPLAARAVAHRLARWSDHVLRLTETTRRPRRRLGISPRLASRLLDDVAEHVRQTMWQARRAAQGESPATSPSPSNDLVHAGDQLACWAARHDTERSARGIGL